jgi:hypothetical protein
MNRLLQFTALSLLLVLCGCQELQGPMWTSDSRRIAYTAYTQTSGGLLETSVYTVDADDDGAEQTLVAKGAAFPHWMLDNATLYYLGDRDQQGFYTKIYKTKVGANGAPQVALANQRLTGFQMAADGSVALLFSGRDGKPGSPGYADKWEPATTGKVDNTIRQLGEMYSPALLAGGNGIAFSTKPGDQYVLWICELNGSKPNPVFPTADQNEPSAAPFVSHAFPVPSDRILFYSPGGSTVFTIRRNGDGLRRYPLPEGISSPVMVSIADENVATLTMAQVSGEKVSFQAYRLDFTTKKFTPVGDPGPSIVGGDAADPRSYHHTTAPRYAWISPAGLALGEPGKARYFPNTATEFLAACALQLKQGEVDKALASVEKAREFTPGPEDPGELDRAESRVCLAAKQYERAGELYEHALLHYPIGNDGLTFLFPPNSGLPRSVPASVTTQLKEMDALIKAAPANQKLPLLRQALQMRIDGKHDKALELYPKIAPLCADQALVAGLRFQEALCQFETGDVARAAEKWEQASRVSDFSQAQYAAGLSAVCYVLDAPHADVVPKAIAALALPAAKGGPLATEFSQLLTFLKGKSYREHEKGPEQKGDGGVSTWAEYDRYYIPFASLRPQRIVEKGAKPVEMHIGARPVTVSAIWLNNGSQDPICRVPFETTSPILAPGAKHVAFVATGDIFPLPPKSCEIYVVDLRGQIILGDAQAIGTGQLARRSTISNMSWSDPNDLKIIGTLVDAFGGETAYSKNVLVPAAIDKGK